MSDVIVKTDVAIIGAGPSGLFSVFECGMLGMKCVVFDSLPDIGGQCTALYPEKPIYDIPAAPSILAGDLIHNLQRQIEPFHPIFFLGQQIVSLEKQGSYWRLLSSKGIVVEASAVIIAAGAGAFGPNRPPLEGLEHYEAIGAVQYMVRRKDDFKNKNVVIAGGGDSAVDWALSLVPVAKHVTVLHRRDKFRAAPESVRQMEVFAQEGKITLAVPYQLHALDGKDKLSSIVVADLEGGIKTIPADVLLAFYGLAASLGPVAEWGLALDKNHVVVDPFTCQTNVAGIYAVGDIASYKNKLKLILTGFHEAALAAHAIRHQLKPDEAHHFEYSTTKGMPNL